MVQKGSQSERRRRRGRRAGESGGQHLGSRPSPQLLDVVAAREAAGPAVRHGPEAGLSLSGSSSYYLAQEGAAASYLVRADLLTAATPPGS